MSSSEFAKMLGVSTSTLHNYEADKHDPSSVALARLYASTGIGAEYIMMGDKVVFRPSGRWVFGEQLKRVAVEAAKRHEFDMCDDDLHDVVVHVLDQNLSEPVAMYRIDQAVLALKSAASRPRRLNAPRGGYY